MKRPKPTTSSTTDAVVKRVIEGTATEKERGIVLKTLKNSLGASLVSSLNDMLASMNRLNDLTNDATDKLETLYKASSDLMDLKALMEFIDSVQKRQMQLIELNRKISQGKEELFASDNLSDEERQVLRLFKSFNSNLEKEHFMHLVRTELAKYHNEEELQR